MLCALISKRSEAAIFPIQSSNSGTCPFEAAIIDDHIVCNREPLFTRRLNCQDATRLLDRFRIAHEQALELGIFVAIDNKHAIDKLSEF